jgi:hypothetical protein
VQLLLSLSFFFLSPLDTWYDTSSSPSSELLDNSLDDASYALTSFFFLAALLFFRSSRMHLLSSFLFSFSSSFRFSSFFFSLSSLLMVLVALLSFLSYFLSPSVVLMGGREALLAVEAESSLLLPSPSCTLTMSGSTRVPLEPPPTFILHAVKHIWSNLALISLVGSLVSLGVPRGGGE